MEENNEVFVEQKKSKKLLYLVLIILGIALIGTGAYFYFGKSKDDGGKKEDASSKPALKDDFYNYINYETISKAKIPTETGTWDRYYDATEVINDRKSEIVEEILNDPNYKNEELDKRLEVLNDYETRNKNGYSELQSYFKMIDDAKTIEEFNKVSLVLNRDFAFQTVLVGAVDTDVDDTTKKVYAFNQYPGDLNELYVYENSKYARYKEAYIELRKHLLKEFGYDETKINEISKQIDEYNEYMYNKSIKSEELNDFDEKIALLRNKKTLEELKKELTNLPVEEYLKGLKLNDLENYVVPDFDAMKAFNEYYPEHLSVIKEMTKIRLLFDFYAVTEEGEKYLLEWNNKLSNTQETIGEQRLDTILSLKSSFVDDEVQKRYEAKYFKEEDKKLIREMVQDVIKEYKKLINECDWLSADTKKEALVKLDSIKVNVGYQDVKKEEKEVYNYVSKADGGTLISNTIGSNRLIYDNVRKSFDKKVETETMNTLEVNAGYMPLENSINFLAGYKELYENETNYYRILGILGDTIGHEISHAFDSTGSKFDEKGQIKEWWTEEDRANYKKLSQKIIDYYAKYEYMGFKVDGEKTLGENIADLGGMKVIVAIAESKGATNEDFKNMFEAFASADATKMNKESAEAQILGDEHAPNQVRINGVLSSTDKFYEVYDIKEGDKMYVPKEERVSLW